MPAFQFRTRSVAKARISPNYGVLLLLTSLFAGTPTLADTVPTAKTVEVPASPAEVPAQAGSEEEITNERIKTLDGSKSPWSGQFNTTYSGSTLNHPFSADAPNPGHFVPPPVVLMTGTLALRYRYDTKTTAGVGSGVGTETPLQGPKNTRASDPYVDVSRIFTLGILHNRADVSYKVWTNHQYRDTFGYREGWALFTDSYVELYSRLTLGLSLNAYANTFAAGHYNRSQQIGSQFYVDPFLEYRINKTFNFRTVLASTYAHTRNQKDADSYKHLEDFQMVGLGIAATQDLYFYVYVKAFPYTKTPVTEDNTLLGLNMIINLF